MLQYFNMSKLMREPLIFQSFNGEETHVAGEEVSDEETNVASEEVSGEKINGTSEGEETHGSNKMVDNEQKCITVKEKKVVNLEIIIILSIDTFIFY